MNRRGLLKLSALAGLAGLAPIKSASSMVDLCQPSGQGKRDRSFWVAALSRIASPILANIAKGQLRQNMPMVLSSNFNNGDPNVGYLEAFGRLLAGMAPWLGLPDDETDEARLRRQFLGQALAGIRHGVDSASPDYFAWRGDHAQPLVDAAHLAQAFLRAPEALWYPLSPLTKARVVEEFKLLRRFKPRESNWLLFAAMTETLLYAVGAECDRSRIDYAVEKFDAEWYVGDGWYSDGPRFSFDHYNGYVIHCMQVEVLKHNIHADTKYAEMYGRAYKRMQRYAHHLERMIAPDGSYLVVGRSSGYRNGAFQPLALAVLDKSLPKDIDEGQVRAALTAVKRHLFVDSSFDENGWLTMGIVGERQSNIADFYTNVGSMYVASLSFLPLGLPADDTFWTISSKPWTSQLVFEGKKFPKDYYVNY